MESVILGFLITLVSLTYGVRQLNWTETCITVMLQGSALELVPTQSRQRQSKRLRDGKQASERRKFTITKQTTVSAIKLMVSMYVFMCVSHLRTYRPDQR